MRTIKELLVLLRDILPDNIGRYSGMCPTLYWVLLKPGLITDEEALRTYAYIKSRKPEKQHDDLWWWPEGELEPRLEFLDKLINELKDE